MVNNKKLMILVVFALVSALLFSLVLGSIGSGSGDSDGFFKKQPKVLCSTKVDADSFSEPDLETPMSCITVGECTSLFTASPFGFFSSSGKVIFDSGDDRQVKSFKVSVTGRETISATLCTNADSVQISLLNEDGQQVDSATVEVN